MWNAQELNAPYWTDGPLKSLSDREASLLNMGLDPDEFVESKIDPAQFKLADWPNAFKDLGYPCYPCAMCGHKIRWAVGFRHIPSGELILVGEDCADYLDSDNVVEKQMKMFKTMQKNKAEKLAQLARNQEWRDANPDVVAALAEVEKKNNPLPFMVEMVHAYQKYGSLTEGQTKAVKNIMVKQAEFEARKEAEKPAQSLMGGKRLCEGEVKSLKLQHDDYYNTSTWKMLVQLLDGNRVWGTVPKSLRSSVEHMRDLEGQRVSLLANVIVSDNDENFGFFKNPSKAVIERV